MISDENRYWPFDILPPERRSEQHDREIRFLETADREGYRPYLFGAGNLGSPSITPVMRRMTMCACRCSYPCCH